MNKKVSCNGWFDRLGWSSGDCIEAVHQPEDLIVAAVPEPGWKFLRWSNGPYEIDPETNTVGYCPCSEKDPEEPECKILFDQIGHYTANGSYDVSYCVAEFVEEPVVYDDWGGGGLGGVLTPAPHPKPQKPERPEPPGCGVGNRAAPHSFAARRIAGL